LEDGEWLSGYQKIRVKVIRTAGYQVIRTEGGRQRTEDRGQRTKEIISELVD